MNKNFKIVSMTLGLCLSIQAIAASEEAWFYAGPQGGSPCVQKVQGILTKAETPTMKLEQFVNRNSPKANGVSRQPESGGVQYGFAPKGSPLNTPPVIIVRAVRLAVGPRILVETKLSGTGAFGVQPSGLVANVVIQGQTFVLDPATNGCSVSRVSEALQMTVSKKIHTALIDVNDHLCNNPALFNEKAVCAKDVAGNDLPGCDDFQRKVIDERANLCTAYHNDFLASRNKSSSTVASGVAVATRVPPASGSAPAAKRVFRGQR